MVTISDVSRQAGVSTATVSRVINRPELVDPGTREAVLKVVAEMNYRPNEHARSLASKASRTIGIVINLFGSPYYGQMLDGAVDVLRSVGYRAIVESSGATVKGEEVAWDSVRGRSCDAMIMHSDLLSDERLTELMAECPTAVLMNRRLGGFEGRCVYLDNIKGGAMAADCLLAHGHTRIAMIKGPSSYFEVRDRATGFQQALEQRGLSPAVERDAHFDEVGGEAAMLELLDASPDVTAVFCHSDEMAAGALQACRKRGVKVPDELSLIGFDNLDLSGLLTPRLTTVRQPLREMGRASAQLAHSLIATTRTREHDDIQHIFDPEIIERESVTPVPGQTASD